MNTVINKESTIADDQPSYNLIDRFPDTYDIIFSYLDVESLLNACLVCKSWNEHIGQSSELMQKVQVNLRIPCYEMERKKALETIKGWKRKICHIRAMIFLSSLEAESLMLCFNQNPLILKHLVTINIVTSYPINNILIASKLLKNLTFELFEDMPKTDWTELVAGFKTFHLEKLSMISTYESNDIWQLLETQMQLVVLKLTFYPICKKVVEVIAEMKTLKVLTLIDRSPDEPEPYDHNTFVGNMPSLESFNIIDSSWILYRPIINAAHYLISLSMEYLDQEFISFAGSKLKNLKQLNVSDLESINDISNPDLFPTLEEVQIDAPIRPVHREFILQEIFNGPTTNFLRCLNQEIIKPKHNDAHDQMCPIESCSSSASF